MKVCKWFNHLFQSLLWTVCPSLNEAKDEVRLKKNLSDIQSWQFIGLNGFALIILEVKVKLLSHVRLFVTPWTVAHQAPSSMEFSRQEYWSRLPFSSPGVLPDSGIEPRSPTLQADALPSEPPGKPIILENTLILKRRKSIIFELH